MFIVVGDRMFNLAHYDRISIVKEDNMFSICIRHSSDSSEKDEYVGVWETYQDALMWFNLVRQKLQARDQVFEVK